MRLKLFNLFLLFTILFAINYTWGDRFYSLYSLFGSPGHVQSLLNSVFLLVALSAFGMIFIRTIIGIALVIIIALLLLLIFHFGLLKIF